MDENFDSIFDAKSEEISEVTNTEETIEQTTETVEAPVETTQETPAETVTTEAPATVEAEQPRDDKGRFAQKEQTVPLNALLAERQRAQAAAQERAEMEQRLREYEERASQTNRPDPYGDPDGYEAYLQQQVERRIEQRLHQEREAQRAQAVAHEAQQMFTNFATTVVNHQPEEVTAVLDYAAQRAASDEAWGQFGLRQPDPVAWFAEQRNRQVQFEEYQRDPQGFIARKAAEMSLATAAQPAVATSTQMATKSAPISLASASGAVSAPPTERTDAEDFNAIFNPKR